MTLLITAKASAGISYDLMPASIDRQISTRGLEKVHDEIFSDHFATNMVLLAIDSGRQEWLRLARKFIRLRDVRSENRLYMALGEALQWSPDTVLAAAENDLQRICSLEGIYEWRLFSRFLAETAVNRRIRKLQGLKDASLQKKRTQCLKSLHAAKSQVIKSLNNHVPAE